MITYFSVIREMINAYDMKMWWDSNIKPEDQEKAADAMQKWLSTYPNRFIGFSKGDPILGTGRIENGYVVCGLSCSTEKKIELFNFFNKPTTVIKYYNCFAEPKVNHL